MENRAIPPQDIENAYPMSKLQLGMLFHTEYSQNAVYHDIFTYHCRGVYNARAFSQALSVLIENNPVLRTSFNLSDFSEPVQIVYRGCPAPFEEIDYRGYSPQEQRRMYNDWFNKEKNLVFDWKVPPLFKFITHRMEEDKYSLTISFHHSILDGWSVATLSTELFNYYVSIVTRRQTARLRAPKAGFQDYIALEKKALDNRDNESFWKKELEDVNYIRLPRWESNLPDEGFKIKSIPIDDELARKILNVSKIVKAPPKTILLAVHLRVMSLITSEKDVVSGVVYNARPESEDSERALGLFLNTLPFKMEINDLTWREFIKKVFDKEMELQKVRRYPLNEILRKTDSNELFEVGYNFTSFHVYEELEIEQNVLRIVSQDSFEQTNFPFCAQFMYDPRLVMFRALLVYDSKEFSFNQMKRTSEYYINAINEVANNVDSNILYNAPLMGSEYEQIIKRYSIAGFGEINETSGIADLTDYFASKSPNSPAVFSVKTQMTYGQLKSYSDAVAYYLQSNGIREGDSIGVYMDHSPELIIALIAIWKIGAIYVPLDIRYPAERLGFLLQDSRAKVVLSVGGLARQIAQVFRNVALIERAFEQPNTQFSRAQYDPERIAYIIYTSGTTGKPKGTLVPHRGLTNMTSEMNRLMGISPNDRIIQLISLGFDASLFEILMALGNGASLCMVEGDNALPGNRLAKAINAFGVTIMSITPSALSLMPDGDYPSLRMINAGGEQCPRDLAEKWSSKVEFNNVYGPTEATVWSTIYKYQRGDANVPIGRPIMNTRILLMDSNGQISPVGSPGEMYIGGVGVSKGYINNPELTSEKFLPNPVNGNRNDMYYRTGDIALYRPDGNLFYLGRTDSQVKVHGLRIELEEIENAMLAHPKVKSAIASIKQINNSSKQIVAYVVPATGQQLDSSELRTYLRSVLPEYMVPVRYALLDSFPLTDNGKLDRKLLEERSDEAQAPQVKYVAPRNEVEESLCSILSKTLQIERVGVFDDFFSLGGNSILALQTINQINNELNADVSIKTLFENPTVDALSKRILDNEIEEMDADEFSEIMSEIETY